jgi:hypothetical protein
MATKAAHNGKHCAQIAKVGARHKYVDIAQINRRRRSPMGGEPELGASATLKKEMGDPGLEPRTR